MHLRHPVLVNGICSEGACLLIYLCIHKLIRGDDACVFRDYASISLSRDGTPRNHVRNTLCLLWLDLFVCK